MVQRGGYPSSTASAQPILALYRLISAVEDCTFADHFGLVTSPRSLRQPDLIEEQDAIEAGYDAVHDLLPWDVVWCSS